MKRIAITIISALLVLTSGVGLQAKTKKVTLFVAGDSTAQTYNPDETLMRGWAQMLQPYLDSTRVVVENHAIGGRSTGSFIREGRWDKIVESVKPGDWVFIQFGHNDTSPNPQRHVEPEEYKANLKRMCKDVMRKKGHPCILTSIVMRTHKNGVLVDERNHFAEYIQLAREAAAEIKVPMIDMNRLTTDLVLSLGDDASAELYYHVKSGDHPKLTQDKIDDTHLRAKGADAYARILSEEIVRMKLPLASSVRKVERKIPETIRLIEPSFAEGLTLMQALKERKSSSGFTGREIHLQDLSNIVWASVGVNREDGRRTSPTGSNRQEIEVYVFLKTGAYWYNYKDNTLELVKEGDFRSITGRGEAADAYMDMLFIADTDKTGPGSKPGDAATVSYVDVGYVSQNVYLACANAGIGSRARGGWDQQKVTEALGLKPSMVVVLGQTVGYCR